MRLSKDKYIFFYGTFGPELSIPAMIVSGLALRIACMDRTQRALNLYLETGTRSVVRGDRAQKLRNPHNKKRPKQLAAFFRRIYIRIPPRVTPSLVQKPTPKTTNKSA